MACVNKILILLGLVSLGFLIPSSAVAATARDVGTKSAPEGVTNPTITMVIDDYLNYLNPRDDTIDLITFNVEGDYSAFIQQIRDKFNASLSPQGIPTLPVETNGMTANRRWLDIALVAGDRRITVRLQRSNLYVRGYRRSSDGDSDDFFYEFSDSIGMISPESRNLGFSGTYGGSRSLESNVNRGNLQLGPTTLEHAVRTLARLNPPTGSASITRDVSRSLLVIVQMVAEAARFQTISNHIAEHYEYGGVTLEDYMVSQQNGWAQLSTAILRLPEDATEDTRLPNIPDNNPALVYTLGEALLALALLIRSTGSSRSTPDYGRSLMNLEYVRVNSIIDEEHRANNVFGTVRVDDGWYTYDFIRRERHESQRLPPGAFATLTDSHPFPVSGMDAFTVNVTLFEGSRGTSDDTIAEGYILWDRFVESITYANYDKHLQRVVKGDYGDVTVGYSVMSYALAVTVQVYLIDADKEGPAMIYGTVKASQLLQGSAGLAPITLFDRSDSYEDRVQVHPNRPFPLARKVLAASISTQLTITADLWDHDYLSLDDNIALGSANFTVRPGTQTTNIKGRYGEVQVVVICA